MSDQQYPMFFYGTLMSGESAHALLGDLVQRREPATLPGAQLFSLGAYPMVVAGSAHVRGELCWMSPPQYPELLVRLDRYEGPQYARVLRTVRVDCTQQEVEAWVYMGTEPPSIANTITNGDWRRRQETQTP